MALYFTQKRLNGYYYFREGIVWFLLLLCLLLSGCAQFNNQVENIGATEIAYDDELYTVLFYKTSDNGGFCEFKRAEEETLKTVD